MAQHTPNARYERLETGSSNGGEEQEKEMESVVANQSAQGAAQTQPAAQPAVQQQPPPYIIGYAPYGGQLPAPNAATQQQTSNNNVVVATQPTAMPPVEVVNPHLKQKPTVMIVTIVLTVVCLVQFCWPALVCLTPALIAAVVGFALSDSGSAEQRHTAKAFHAVAVCCNIATVVYYVVAAIVLIITLASIFGSQSHYDDGCYSRCNYDGYGNYAGCNDVCY